MRKVARVLSIVAIAALLISVLAVPASAISSAPYKGYNYDPYGSVTSAPLGYTPNKTYDFRTMGLDGALIEPEDMTVYTDAQGVQTLWIADSGNNRILQLNSDYKVIKILTCFTDEEGKTYDFVAPQSIYIKYNEEIGSDEIFICTGGSKIGEDGKPSGDCFIFTGTADGKLIKVFKNPTDAVIKLDDFKPSSVVMDDSGFLYVHVESCTEGLVVMRYSDGTFKTYYGANKVVLTWETAIQQTWKKIFKREATVGTISLTPTEISGIFIRDGFIYTTTSSADMDKNLRVRKLNALGNNVLQGDANALVDVVFGERERTSASADTRMMDLHVDQDGVMACLDAYRGRVYLYDETCTLLTVFGYKTDGSGNTQNGATFDPVAVDKFGDDYIVLDSKVGTVVSYSPTYYIEMLQEANSYYLKGWYIEGESYWREVIKYDANFARGYAAIGKSLLEQEKYEEALEWLEKGQDRTSYSTAYSEYRTEFLRANFYWFIPLIVAIVAAIILLIKWIQHLLGVRAQKANMKFN